MRKRRSLLKDNVTAVGFNSPYAATSTDMQQPQQTQQQPGGNHFSHHSHVHHSLLPPLSDAYEKSSREFEDIFDIDIDTLPPSFFAEALGSLIGEGNESSLLNEDMFLDTCSSRCVKRCYSAPPSPLSGILADFDEQSSMMDLIAEAQAVADASGSADVSVTEDLHLTAFTNPTQQSATVDDALPEPLPWSSLSTNDVIDVLEAATQRLTAEQLQREATAAVEAKMQQQKQQQQVEQQQQQLPRPPSAPPPSTYLPPPPLPPLGSLSTRSDDAYTLDGYTFRNGWRQPRRPRSTVPTASLMVSLPNIRQHDIVRSRLASLATRRLRDKLIASSSSDRSPLSISSDQFPYDFDNSSSRHSSSSTPAMLTPVLPQSFIQTPHHSQPSQPASSLATLFATASSNVNGSSDSRIVGTSTSSSVASTSAAVNVPSSSTGDMYRCFYPTCTLSYDRPVRLSAHLLHHVYGMTGPYRCDVPTCSISAGRSLSSTTTKICKTFPTTKQLWGHVESSHPEIFEKLDMQPVDFIAMRHKSPVQCPACDCTFIYAFQLYLHLRSVHIRPSHRSTVIAEKRFRPSENGTPAKTSQSASSFTCRLCGFSSTTMSGLLLHLQRRQHRQAAARKPLPTSQPNATQRQLVFHGPLQQQHHQILQPSVVVHTTKPAFLKATKLISTSLPTSSSSKVLMQQPLYNNNTALLVDSSSRSEVVVVVNPNNTNNNMQNTRSTSSSTSNGDEKIPVVAATATGSNPQPEEVSTSPFYFLQRVVLVNVSQ